MLTLHRVSYPRAGPKSCPAGAGCSRLSLCPRSHSRWLLRQGGIGHSQRWKGTAHSTAVSQRGLSPARFNDEEVCMCPQVSVPQQFYSIPWNTFNRDVLKSLYGFAPISMHCNKSSAVRFPVGAASLPKLPDAIPRFKVGSVVLRTHPSPAGSGQGVGAAWKSLASAGHGAQPSPGLRKYIWSPPRMLPARSN